MSYKLIVIIDPSQIERLNEARFPLGGKM